MENFILDTSFSRCHSDNNLYTKSVNLHPIVPMLYVDYLVLTSNDPKLINHVKYSHKDKFDMTYLGYISESTYACDLIHHFCMEYCKLDPSPYQYGFKLSLKCDSPKLYATLYRQLAGIFLYLTHSHPDISFVLGLVS